MVVNVSGDIGRRAETLGVTRLKAIFVADACRGFVERLESEPQGMGKGDEHTCHVGESVPPEPVTRQLMRRSKAIVPRSSGRRYARPQRPLPSTQTPQSAPFFGGPKASPALASLQLGNVAVLEARELCLTGYQGWCPRQELNLNLTFRKRELYPFELRGHGQTRANHPACNQQPPPLSRSKAPAPRA